ncbi:MAG: hypothetical protein RMK57_05125 [Bryobacterales bacterium]|nr:hypothetical protein [Bryobacteraceae bacterium]MDW8353896.1 hypothetical protein [Bryobacterales bacterium]
MRGHCAALLAALGMLAGCGGYEDFVLPSPGASPSAAGFRWLEHPAPVLPRGRPGDWDGVDALNPSVVRYAGRYYNFYSGFDGQTWRTGLAVSADGVAWEKLGRVLEPDPRTWEGGYIAANGSARRFRGEFYCWYQAGEPPQIGLARSADGRTWRKHPEPVLRRGPRGSWDERGVADPYVIEVAGMLYMYFLGQDRARRQRLGVARSEDGVTWRKLRANPILELGEAGAFDENGLGEPAVWASHGSYWMLYTGRDRAEYRRIGLARSPDGVRWRRVSESALAEGSRPWNSAVVCDPTVLEEGGRLRVWFGGGDRPRPDERLNGQIGLAELEPLGATLSK